MHNAKPHKMQYGAMSLNTEEIIQVKDAGTVTGQGYVWDSHYTSEHKCKIIPALIINACF